jgi:hypothetical protein
VSERELDSTLALIGEAFKSDGFLVHDYKKYTSTLRALPGIRAGTTLNLGILLDLAVEACMTLFREPCSPSTESASR